MRNISSRAGIHTHPRMHWPPAPLHLTSVTMPPLHDKCKQKVHLFITVERRVGLIIQLWKLWHSAVCLSSKRLQCWGWRCRGEKIALQLLLLHGAHEGGETHKKDRLANTHTQNTVCIRTTSSSLAGVINPVQREKILTLNRKVLLRLQEALIYVGTFPSTLIIPMQVQAQILHPPSCTRMLGCTEIHIHTHIYEDSNK